MMNQPKIIALVWAPHEARTASFAEWLNAKLYNIHYLKSRRPLFAPFKYILQWVKTWQVLLTERPDFIYVTNSPPVAGLCVMLYTRLTNSQFIMDTHSPTLFNRKWGWTRALQRFTARYALMNILDQERFKQLFESWGARAMVLENPPKNIPAAMLVNLAQPETPEFAYVGTFASDEPVEIVIAAARRLPHCHFYILGDRAQARREWLADAPPNVTFTGYLLKADFWGRLYSARALIILTVHPHSLLGGAMDGLYIDKPVIISDQPTLREFFTQGAVFIENTPDGMTAGIETLLAHEARYNAEMRALRQHVEDEWIKKFEALKHLVQR